MARPIPMTILSAALLLVLAFPVLHLRTGITDITAFPDSIDGVAGIKLLNEKWPQGTELQLQVVVTNADRPDDAGGDREAQDRGPQARRAERAGRRHAVTATARSRMVSFTMAGGQNDEANRAARPPGPEPSSTRRSSAALPDVRTLRHRRRRVLGRRDQGLRGRGRR